MKRRRWYGREAELLRTITGEPDAVAAIIMLARELLDEVDFTSPPFDPRVVASFRDIREVRLAAMRGAARLIPDGDSLVAEVNKDHSLGKRNFSADHEVIHTLLPTYSGQGVDDVVTGTFAGSEEELLCDIGAATLLLDGRRLRPLVADAGPSLATLVGMAELFQASLQATALAIADLDLWPCAIVFWEDGYRKGEAVSIDQAIMPGFEGFGGPPPELRVASRYVTSTFGTFIAPNKSIPRASLIGQCRTSEYMTWGDGDFDLGRGIVRLYCENAYVPYHVGGVLRSRVVSMLVPKRAATACTARQLTFEVESI
jgi:hypothetical protein